MRGGKLYALVLSSIVSIAMSLPRLRNLLFVGLLLLVGGALLASYLLSWQPADREAAPLHCQGAAPALKPGQALKVMTWNIQYLAGKRYVFWDDLPDATGPDQRPTAEDLAFTLDEVVRVIRDEQPDLVLLQEIDDGSSATDDQDQLALIQERINDLYHCSAQAYEWKSAFVPTPHIFGSVGRKQATLSRYRIDSAERRQLPPRDGGLFDRLFGPR
ncbi:endonuclease/exonuclease/phosphatase family protein, partial [Pseudomonas aeruginosa]|nr:endonuclease/exonuclease/phosphatase family protein [Pseudomonas aeruginosa]MBF3347002.1 endonuclease/exonuclease/phosphatase family protein [Pseudomonas aeruginosa]